MNASTDLPMVKYRVKDTVDAATKMYNYAGDMTLIQIRFHTKEQLTMKQEIATCKVTPLIWLDCNSQDILVIIEQYEHKLF